MLPYVNTPYPTVSTPTWQEIKAVTLYCSLVWTGPQISALMKANQSAKSTQIWILSTAVQIHKDIGMSSYIVLFYLLICPLFPSTWRGWIFFLITASSDCVHFCAEVSFCKPYKHYYWIYRIFNLLFLSQLHRVCSLQPLQSLSENRSI